MENALVESVIRLLNDEPNSTSTSGGGASSQPQPRSQGRDFYEFAAFLAWYLVLVLCCVVPALCAYHRRRTRERRMQLMFLRGSTLDGRPFTVVATEREARRIFSAHEERLRAEKMTAIQEAIKNTTMIVTEIDLVEKAGNERTPISEPVRIEESSIQDEEEATPKHPVDEGQRADPNEYEPEYEFAALRLPSKTGEEPAPNGARNVPPACTICLCPYEVKDEVTWSPKDHCSHAFHKDCLLQWLEKKEQPLCPVCRQEFCDLSSSVTTAVPATTNTGDSETRNDVPDV